MTADAERRGGGGVRATYRVQFNHDFTFADAARLSNYFEALGISHLYASPIFAARAGSEHGYDIVDPTRISAEIGGEDGFRGMAAALADVGIGIILDIVPNHMAADAANPFWMDVLEFGADAASAGMFDIDLARRIALPWLGDEAAAIDALRYDAAAGRVLAVVAGNSVPLRPASVAELLERIGALEPAASFRAIERRAAGPESILFARQGLRAAVAEAHESFNQALAGADRDAIHAAQHWQAVPWRQTEALNYRRFFDVSHLLGVRVEDDAAFDLVHRLPLALLAEGLVQGLRVDHIDGLADPAAYTARLRAAAGPDALILAEKILGRGETLRPWPVDGTTGYERLNLINEAFVSAKGRARLQAHLEGEGLIAGAPDERLFSAKSEVIERSFRPELARLAASAAALLADDPPLPSALEAALVALVAAFPVYRSYIAALPADPADAALWTEAARRVARLRGDAAGLADRLIAAALERPDAAGEGFRRLFQQLSGPAMAKGFEDTELYRSVALASVNEVGSDLAAPARDLAALHAGFAGFGEGGLTPLATHDTKRGADTRARLNLLSHHAAEWIGLVAGWQRRHAAWKRDGAPDGLDEWLIYETLYGAFPLSRERAWPYFEKAMREAKRRTLWSEPDEAYEAAVGDFVAVLVDGPEGAPFRRELRTFVERTARGAAVNSLAQTVLQLTLPGIPDLYRGGELADFSLVDPDNRRPVDWQRRVDLLAASPAVPLAEDAERVAKLRFIRSLLALRARDPALFAAPYRPLAVEPGWLAFTRDGPRSRLLVALPLTPAAAEANRVAFGDTAIDGAWRPIVTEGATAIADGVARVDPALPLLVLLGAARPRGTHAATPH